MFETSLQVSVACRTKVVFGGLQENDVWQQRINHEFSALYGESNIMKVAETGRCTQQVTSLPEYNPPQTKQSCSLRSSDRAQIVDPKEFTKFDVQQNILNKSYLNVPLRDTVSIRVNRRLQKAYIDKVTLFVHIA